MEELHKPKEEAFAQHAANGESWLRAYELAGYPAPSRAKANALSLVPRVRNRIEALYASKQLADENVIQQVHARLGLTHERVLRELMLMGFARQSDYLDRDSDGNPYYNLDKATPDQLAAIQELHIEEYTAPNGKGQPKVKRRITKLKLYDKRAALLDLGKHLDLGRFATGAGHGAEGSAQGAPVALIQVVMAGGGTTTLALGANGVLEPHGASDE